MYCVISVVQLLAGKAVQQELNVYVLDGLTREYISGAIALIMTRTGLIPG